MSRRLEADVEKHLKGLGLRVRELSPREGVWTHSQISEYNRETIRVVSEAREAIGAAEAAAELCSAHQRASILAAVAHWNNELERLRVELREALVERKRHTDSLHDRQRSELLLGGGGSYSSPTSPGPQDALDKGKRITTSLVRSRKLMADQVQRMSGIAAQVSEQDALLKCTLMEHQGVGGSIRRAGGLLSSMRRQQMLDWLVIVGATLFYIFTVLYIVWSRVPGFGVF